MNGTSQLNKIKTSVLGKTTTHIKEHFMFQLLSFFSFDLIS